MLKRFKQTFSRSVCRPCARDKNSAMKIIFLCGIKPIINWSVDDRRPTSELNEVRCNE